MPEIQELEAMIAEAERQLADVDFASGDFRVGGPYCFVTVPAVQMNVNP